MPRRRRRWRARRVRVAPAVGARDGPFAAPPPRRSIATSCSVSPASRSARRSKLHRFADRPGTHTTAGASVAPHRRTRCFRTQARCRRPRTPWRAASFRHSPPRGGPSEDSPAMSAEHQPRRPEEDIAAEAANHVRPPAAQLTVPVEVAKPFADVDLPRAGDLLFGSPTPSCHWASQPGMRPIAKSTGNMLAGKPIAW